MTLTKENVAELLVKGDMDLQPTQSELSFPIIKRLYSKMSISLLLRDSIQVCDDLIIDGHHRYIAAILAGYKLSRVPSLMSSAKQLGEWKDVTLVDTDWDSASDINTFNEEDARYNGLTLEEIVDIIT
jgi:hypothetical protein